MILTDLRHKALEMVLSQPSEENEPFVIHKTYEEFLCELIVKECANFTDCITQNFMYRHFGIPNERTN